jgi:hypothetical protein
MAIAFGALEDITTDPEGLRALLETPAESDGGEELLAADPDPGWEQPGLGERMAGAVKGPAAGQKKVSAAVKRDVQAKLAMMSKMATGLWKARDPLCGQVAEEAIPDVSEALADILCDSPDIVAWFTSGGNYMKWLNLLMALQPVLGAVAAHHIMHTVTLEEEPPQDWAGYAA